MPGRLMADHRCRYRRAAMHPSAAGHHDPHGAFVDEPGVAGFGVFYRLGRLRQCRRKEIVNAGHGRAVGLNSPDRRRAQRNLLKARILGLGSARDPSGNGKGGDGHVQRLAHELALRGVGVAGEHDADKARRQKEPLHGATSKTVPPPSDARAKQSLRHIQGRSVFIASKRLKSARFPACRSRRQRSSSCVR